MTAFYYIQNSFLLFCITFLSLLFTSCGSNKVSTESFKYSYCSSENAYHQNIFVMDTISFYENIFQSSLPSQDIIVCKVLGVAKEVDQILLLKKDSSLLARQQSLELKQIITQRISLAKTELDALISELDCEGERADLAAGYLDDINSAKNVKLTVGSVIIGALTTVAVEIFKNDDTQAAIGISGGLISAGLGALTINPKGKRIEFYHLKNILTPIWRNSNSYEYPDLIWNIFQIKNFNNEEYFSLQESTKKRWLKFVLNEEISPENEILFFGKGGDYTAEKLHMRSEMIDQVKSSARYINQILSTFEANLYRVYIQ